MALREEIKELEQEITRDLEEVKRSFAERQDILYHMCYGVGVKLDILQAIVLETINEISPEVKLKVLNKANLESIAEVAQAELQRRMDTLGWSEHREAAPMDQLEQDMAKVDDI